MIISSILDNDLYKFTMQQAVINLYPTSWALYQFINRGGTKFPKGFDLQLYNEVRYFSELKIDQYEKMFLQSIYFLKPPYVDFLCGYKYNPNEVTIDQEDGDLYVSVKGPWYRTILWEVPLLALISELYFKTKETETNISYREKTKEKAIKLMELQARFADFGTRRRYSRFVQDIVVGLLNKWSNGYFNGTSNIHFAQIHNIKAIGTQAHEWTQFHAAKYGFKYANETSMEKWVEVYQGDLGIALADTYTSPAFFKSFNTKYAKLHDGIRQDSGDPFAFIEMAIQHYKKLNIDPLTKTIVFSDGLDIDKVEEIEKVCKGRIKTSYGIGTNLTNDVVVQPLNMVIKMTACKPDSSSEWINTCKLSDAQGKYTGDPNMIELCKQELGIH